MSVKNTPVRSRSQHLPGDKLLTITADREEASSQCLVSIAVGEPRSYVVVFDVAAVLDFEDVKSKGERKAVFNAVHKLKELGADLPSPHMKSLQGEKDLFELRPKQGASPVRPIYARVENRFVILALASDKGRFDRAVVDARERIGRHR